MSTPTPRTDSDCFILPDMELVVSADFARKLERQLATEREKVRVLQEAMKFLANKDMYFQVKFDPCQRASAALAATEDKQ